MIVSLILLLILVVMVAFFIGKNLGNSCAIWFFKDFGQTNIVIIVFLAFAAGIIVSLLLMLIGKGLKTARTYKEQKVNSAHKTVRKDPKKNHKHEDDVISDNVPVTEIKTEKKIETAENIDK